MGVKESKISFFPFEEVQKRVTEDELKRLRLAFKRIAGASGVMSKTLFIREVLGDAVPIKLAEQMYVAFGGGSKGIGFKDLISGLALLTRGSLMDKLRLIFEIYSTDGNYIYQNDMESLLLTTEGGHVPQTIKELFVLSEKVSSSDFCDWLRRNPDAITLSQWLIKQGNTLQLTDYGETPTFYQTLAKFTGLRETDIIELEKRYWYLKTATKTGKFDLETFTPHLSTCVSDWLATAFFNAFDENQDGHIDFRELARGVATCCRGPIAQRIAFTFNVFDEDRDGLLSQEEITNMITALIRLKLENIPDSSKDNTDNAAADVKVLIDEIMNDYDADKDGFVTPEEYKRWATSHSLARLLLDILFQVCHVVFGLRPATRKDEYQVIWGWLDRENVRGLQPGKTWYLISMTWWMKWKDFIGNQKSVVARSLSTSELERNGVVLAGQINLKCNGLEATDISTRKVKTPRRLSQPNQGVTSTLKANGIDASRPGSINNSNLIEADPRKIQSLTADGGKLKCSLPLVQGRDFEIVPELIWRTLVQWYTGSPALPRNVIISSDGEPLPTLELFPRVLKLYRHSNMSTKSGFSTWSGIHLGLSGFNVAQAGSGGLSPHVVTPRRQFSYTATFSRMNTLQQVFDFVCQKLRFRYEDVRLWNMADENNLQLLDEDQFSQTLESLGIVNEHPILIEVRNRDMSWPEEMTSMALNKAIRDKRPHGKGMTGLSNLGNTCFMNSAIQCMSNTIPLTSYFTEGYHMYELNKSNPLGMKGVIALRYGEVVQDLWSTNYRSIAPLKLRWTIGRYAPRFNGFQQQDSQEFLAFLLDGLHEDLNRVQSKPYVELKDSDGRPDEDVAHEAWDNHLKRNKSIVVDLFQGQLRSCVRCLKCDHVSVRFDPYTFLSLPIPMDNSIYVECIVVTLDGSVPVKYGLLLNTEDTYKTLKKELARLCSSTPSQLLMAELLGAVIKGLPLDNQKVRCSLSGMMYAFEIPLPSTVEEDNRPPSVDAVSVGEATSEEMTVDDDTQSLHCPETNNEETRVSSTAMLCNESSDTQCVRSVSQSSSERNHGGSLKIPCISRQTSDEGLDIDTVTSGKSNAGFLKQFSPRFLRSIPSKKNSSSFSEGLGSHLSIEGSKTSYAQANVKSANSSDSNVASSSITVAHSASSQVSKRSSRTSYLIGFHRKLMRLDVYFIAPQKNRRSLFGYPLIIPCCPNTKNSDLYSSVWRQISRFVSAHPPGDDSLSNSEQGYPFQLKIVDENGLVCAQCCWFKFCRGCTIECNDKEFNFDCHYVAIEWEPTTLHLRYQSSQEKVFTEHESVAESRRLQTEPIDLYECFKAFTKEEELGEDEMWYCSKCKKHQMACKKLDIWSLPPILIIHLKRFQFMNGRWVKSNKIVNFPMEYFDPSEFVVKRSAEDAKCVKTVNVQTAVDNNLENTGEDSHQEADNMILDQDLVDFEMQQKSSNDSGLTSGTSSTESSIENEDSSGCLYENGRKREKRSKKHELKETRGESTDDDMQCDRSLKNNDESNGIDLSLSNDISKISDVRLSKRGSIVNSLPSSGASSTMSDFNCIDKQLSIVTNMETYTSSMLYNLYTISSHTGVMGGGHYVSFAKNPDSGWYCFNDSSCKETTAERVSRESPYLLFYERVGVREENFKPDICDRNQESPKDDDEIEKEMKKACVLQ